MQWTLLHATQLLLNRGTSTLISSLVCSLLSFSTYLSYSHLPLSPFLISFLSCSLLTYTCSVSSKLRMSHDMTLLHLPISSLFLLSLLCFFLLLSCNSCVYCLSCITPHTLRDPASCPYPLLSSPALFLYSRTTLGKHDWTPAQMWGYLGEHAYHVRFSLPPAEVYQNLLKLVADKDYFVITSNVDGNLLPCLLSSSSPPLFLLLFSH